MTKLTMACLTMACLMFVAGQARADVIDTNHRIQAFPIEHIDPLRRQEIREMLLFASTDQGRMWQQVAIASPDKTSFVFQAPADGEYWFRTAIVNRQGRQEPDNIYHIPLDQTQKLRIDTLRPLARITTVQRQGDDVLVSWEIQEENPDPRWLRLEYRETPAGSWQSAGLLTSLRGETRLRVVQAAVEIRLQAKDMAGNSATAVVDVPGTGIQTARFNVGTQAAAGTQTSAPAQGAPPPIVLAPRQPSTNANGANGGTSPPPVPPGQGKQLAISDSPTQHLPPVEPPNLRPNAGHLLNSGAVSRHDPHTRLVASNESPPPKGHSPIHKPLPPIKYVNGNVVELKYELTRVGPAGLAAVELWFTPNGGQNWELFANDPDVKPNMSHGLYQRELTLDGEGEYGFSLVVKSRAGLGKAPPRAGDAPELRIEVDTTPPVAQLYAPQADPQKTGILQLQWNAQDKNLTPTPITLEWAQRREGPWHVIAQNQANTGKHAWQLPENIPVQVYLRLRVRDLAGNEGIAVTPEPLLVDLTEPEGRIVDVSVPQRR